MSLLKNKNITKILPLLTIITLLLFNVNHTFAQWEIRLDDRDNYAKSASDSYDRGEWEEGKKTVDKGLEKYPKDSDLRMLLGKYYHQKKNYDKARYELIKSLEYNKHNVNAKQILVNVEVESGRYSSAICYVNELLEVNPYWKGLWRKKIEIYRLQGNNVEANRLLKRISQIYPEDSQLKSDYIYYTELEISSRKSEGKLGEAIEMAAGLAEENPRNEDLHLDLINACLKSGDYERALVYTEKALYNLPNSTKLIDKKTDILSYLNRYDEALDFIQLKMKDGGNTGHLQQRYSYFLEEAARHRKKSDPYALYLQIYEKDPKNDEALNYIVSTAISRGLYDDALIAIKQAKSARGETKALLVKEQFVYKSMGDLAKADQITNRLYQLYPEDTDIKEEYLYYRFRQAKTCMEEERYDRAIAHWEYVAENSMEDEEMKKTALMSSFNCYNSLGKTHEAIVALDKLSQEYPTEWEWLAKKAVIMGKQKRYIDALGQYEMALRLVPPTEYNRVLDGYDELATEYTKILIQDYNLKDALQLTEHWLEVNPESELALSYAINISSQMNDHERVMKYANWNSENKEERSLFLDIKLAQAYNHSKEYEMAYDMLHPQVIKNPYHKDLINTFSQTSEDYAKELMQKTEYDKTITVLDTALHYDPNNKSLKYFKGLYYEKIHNFDSAYYYQMFYQPSPMEMEEFSDHMIFLKNKTYKNQVGFLHLRSRYAESDAITTVSSVEYIRSELYNTYTGRMNYAGRPEGTGLQAEFEWGHTWHKLDNIKTRLGGGYGTRFFPYFTLGGAVSKMFKHEWEGEVGLSYRRTYNDQNLLNLTLGVSKEIDPWWLNAKFNSLILDGKWYYSVATQARYYLYDPKNYISATASCGSAPDIDIIENDLYNAYSVTNSMVGLGYSRLLSKRVTAGIFGTWHTYPWYAIKYTEEGDAYYSKYYRNLYNLYLQVHVSF